MKILYKVWIKDQQDCISEFIFDKYEAIEDLLEANYGGDFKLKEFKLITLIKCEGCSVYISNDIPFLIKKEDYGINCYCVVCAPNYEMNIKPFIKKQEK